MKGRQNEKWVDITITLMQATLKHFCNYSDKTSCMKYLLFY